jgi:UPF0755 protein
MNTEANNQYSENPPEHHKGRSIFLTLSVALLFLAVVIVVIIGFGSAYVHNQFLKTNSLAKVDAFTVTSGQSNTQIAANLQSQKFIANALIYRIFLKLNPAYANIQAGVYQLPTHANIAQIAETLANTADVKGAFSIRIIEGSTINEIAANVSQNTSIKAADVINAEQQLARSYSYFGQNPKPQSLEGYLFPDTYYISSQSSASDILSKMLADTVQKITPQMQSDAIKKGRSIQQILTVASLIEKEIGTVGTNLRDPNTVQQERETVAGIIYNRLAAGIPLQLDSTKLYIQPGQTQPDLSYDTYTHTGLPPGPIDNPSLNSIEAAIYPVTTDYMYFLTDSSGTAHFAKTLAEHNQNIAKYLNK